MKSLFACTYPVSPAVPDADFAVTESEDGTLGVATSGMWIRIPFQAYQPLHDILRDQQQQQAGGDPCAANGPSPLPLPAHIRQLVIAAREAWEDATDTEALQRLDKALEPFSEAVPYANEPDRCAVSGKPISPDDWQCGDGKLRAQLALAFAVHEPKLIGDPAFQRVIEDLAYEAGKRATTLALSRLMPGVLDDIEIPF